METRGENMAFQVAAASLPEFALFGRRIVWCSLFKYQVANESDTSLVKPKSFFESFVTLRSLLH